MASTERKEVDELKMPLYSELLVQSRDYVLSSLDISDFKISELDSDTNTAVINAIGGLSIGLYNALHPQIHRLHGSDYDALSVVEKSRSKISRADCTLGDSEFTSHYSHLVQSHEELGNYDLILSDIFFYGTTNEVVNG